MKVILSAAISLDGCLDDTSSQRLKLSSPEDWRAVEKLRAGCDAILVGAHTVRRDNPSLVIKDPVLREERRRQGMDPDIVKVTLTSTGDLDPGADFFVKGEGGKIVFMSKEVSAEQAGRFSGLAEVVRADSISAAHIVDTLAGRGFGSLMVEGGSQVLEMFLREGRADMFRLAIAPFFVGDADAPRLALPGGVPWNKDRRMELSRVEQMGDMAVLWYEFPR